MTDLTFEQLVAWVDTFDIYIDWSEHGFYFKLSQDFYLEFSSKGVVRLTNDSGFSLDIFKNCSPKQMKEIIIAGGLKNE